MRQVDVLFEAHVQLIADGQSTRANRLDVQRDARDGSATRETHLTCPGISAACFVVGRGHDPERCLIHTRQLIGVFPVLVRNVDLVVWVERRAFDVAIELACRRCRRRREIGIDERHVPLRRGVGRRQLPPVRQTLGHGHVHTVVFLVGLRIVHAGKPLERTAVKGRRPLEVREARAWVIRVATNAVSSRVCLGHRHVIGVVGSQRVQNAVGIVVARVDVACPYTEALSQFPLERQRDFVALRLTFRRARDEVVAARLRDEVRPVQVQIHLAWIVVAVAVEIAPPVGGCDAELCVGRVHLGYLLPFVIETAPAALEHHLAVAHDVPRAVQARREAVPDVELLLVEAGLWVREVRRKCGRVPARCGYEAVVVGEANAEIQRDVLRD